jgi:phosphoglycerol transferase MdoB-like AlkP superfamily enzyme
MSQSSSSTTGGVNILGLLGIAFIVLKLTGYIGWSWWWVTAPFWGGLAVFLVIMVVTLLGLVAVKVFSRR